MRLSVTPAVSGSPLGVAYWSIPFAFIACSLTVLVLPSASWASADDWPCDAAIEILEDAPDVQSDYGDLEDSIFDILTIRIDDGTFSPEDASAIEGLLEDFTLADIKKISDAAWPMVRGAIAKSISEYLSNAAPADLSKILESYEKFLVEMNYPEPPSVPNIVSTPKSCASARAAVVSLRNYETSWDAWYKTYFKEVRRCDALNPRKFERLAQDLDDLEEPMAELGKALDILHMSGTAETTTNFMAYHDLSKRAASIATILAKKRKDTETWEKTEYAKYYNLKANITSVMVPLERELCKPWRVEFYVDGRLMPGESSPSVNLGEAVTITVAGSGSVSNGTCPHPHCQTTDPNGFGSVTWGGITGPVNALIARFRPGGSWFFVGTDRTLHPPDWAKELQFAVLDNEWTTNSGSFRVQVTGRMD